MLLCALLVGAVGSLVPVVAHAQDAPAEVSLVVEGVAVPGFGGVSGDQINPGAVDAWYDGLDQNCDGKDDYDADADGYVPEEFIGLETFGVPGSGAGVPKISGP